jgi:6-pyruvoyltetrahydropterin/6-carboxytetrahydropterin synthase
MFEIGIIEEFEAAHALGPGFGPASRLHGHTYRVEIVIRGSRLDAAGTLYPLDHLQLAARALLAPLHYQNLNTLPVFQSINSTVEQVCAYVHRELSAALDRTRLDSLRVTVWESPRVFAACDAPLEPEP